MKSCVKLSSNFFIRGCYQRKKRGILKGIWKLTQGLILERGRYSKLKTNKKRCIKIMVIVLILNISFCAFMENSKEILQKFCSNFCHFRTFSFY